MRAMVWGVLGVSLFSAVVVWAASDVSGGSSDNCNTEESAEDCESEDNDGNETATKSAKSSRHGTTKSDVDCEVIECITVTAPRLQCPVGAICIVGDFNFLLDLNPYYVDPSPPGGGGGGGAAEPEAEPEEEEPDSIDCWSGLTGDSNAEISSGFGNRPRGFHKGVDIPVVTGTIVYAAQDGVVHSTENELESQSQANERGNFVAINYDDGEAGRYLHLMEGSLLVGSGDRVRAGDPIARSNETGRNIDGPHLHYDHNTGPITPGNDNHHGSGTYVDPVQEFADCEGDGD